MAVDPGVAEVLERFRASADALLAVGLAPVDVVDACEVIRRLEAGVRVANAAQVGLLEEIDRRGLHHVDGHRTAKVMVRHNANLSDAEALRRARGVRVCRDLPAVAAAFQKGRIGRCQLDRIARVHANPRVTHLLAEVDADLAVVASRLPYRELDAYLTNWERLADEDGAGDEAERDEARRDFRIGTNLNGSVFIEGDLGSLDGAELRQVHERFTEAELQADWAEARERLGGVATWEDLRRTDAQRRADALMAIIRAAASNLASQQGGSVIVTNVVIDLATFERHLRTVCSDEPNQHPDPRAATLFADLAADLVPDADDASARTSEAEGDDVTPADADADPAFARIAPARSPRDGTGFRCGTLDGMPIDPAAATANALLGHIRRVVVGTDGIVVDMSRRARFFTGVRHLAVLLSQTTCYWPGCHVPVTDCQADHLEGFNSRTRGPTNPHNGGPACPKHNRLKERGFTVHRNADGHWHIYRPDGTEIT